jgi:DNA-binding TFAR19-related protein (PDSD5 family)
MDDEELKQLKKRKLLEIHRRRLRSQQLNKTEDTVNTKEIFDRFFYGRAWEVYKAAKHQHPRIMVEIEKFLLEAIKAGRIKDRISGEDLFSLFRQLKIKVSLESQIRYKKHGELKTIGQKLKEKR